MWNNVQTCCSFFPGKCGLLSTHFIFPPMYSYAFSAHEFLKFTT
jgi:hypothetical protein